MAWLADMRVVSETDLGTLLARLSGRDKPLGYHAVRDVVDRWRRAGLATRRRVFASTPAFVWLTAAGGKQADDSDSWTSPAYSRLGHLAACSRARLMLEAEQDPRYRSVQWTSERRWRAERLPFMPKTQPGKRSGLVVPDGEIVTADGVTAAVEVELSAKGVSRTVDKVLELTRSYDRVIYVVPEASQADRTVHSAIMEAARVQQQADMLGQSPATDKVFINYIDVSGLGWYS